MRFFIMVWMLFVSIGLAQADEPTGETLRVLLRVAPPFVIDEGNGEFSGISVDLWRRVAEDLRLTYEFEDCGLDEMLDRLATGGADVGVGAITVTADREAILDFTHPFSTTGLAVAARSSSSVWTAVFGRLLSWDFVRAIGALVILLLGVGVVMWGFERRRNPGQFEPHAGRGLWSAFWFAGVTMTTVGYGDKAPVSAGGRLVALVWMFTSIIVISFFTASIASVLTVESLNQQIKGPDDLPGLRIGALTGTTSAEYLTGRDVMPVAFTTIGDAVDALARDEVDAILHDEPILLWALKENGDNRLEVLPFRIERQDYALVLPPDDPRREDLNRSLLREIETDEFQRTVEFYLGR